MTDDDTTTSASPRLRVSPCVFSRQIDWLGEHVQPPPEVTRSILRDLAAPEPLAAHLRHILLCAVCLPLMLAIWTCWLAMLLCHDAHLLARRCWRHAAERLFLPGWLSWLLLGALATALLLGSPLYAEPPAAGGIARSATESRRGHPTEPEAGHFLDLWQSLSLVFGVGASGVAIWQALARRRERTDRVRIAPQPLVVRAAEEPVTRVEFDALRARWDSFIVEFREAEAERARRRTELDSELFSLLRGLAAQTADIGGQLKQLSIQFHNSLHR